MISDYIYYLDDLKKEFPDIPEEGLKEVLHHGFKMFQHITAAQGDVLIKDTSKEDPIVAYCGELQLNPLNRCKYETRKWHIKEKLKYDINHKEYEGYYYFGLPEKEGEDLMKKLKSKKQNEITINNTIFRKQLSDVTHDHHLHYIFRLEYPLDVGFTFYKEKFKYPKEFIEYVKLND